MNDFTIVTGGVTRIDRAMFKHPDWPEVARADLRALNAEIDATRGALHFRRIATKAYNQLHSKIVRLFSGEQNASPQHSVAVEVASPTAAQLTHASERVASLIADLWARGLCGSDDRDLDDLVSGIQKPS